MAAVYEVTKKPIEESQNRKRAEAINKVLPGFAGTTETVKVMPPTGKDSVTLNMAYADGQLFVQGHIGYGQLAQAGHA